MDERLAWLISDILSDDNARIIGFGRNSILNLDRPAAVKTGTTSNFHDNWTVGYTPGLIVGVWAGNTNYEPMRDVSGITGAAPIWHEVIRSFLSGQPEQSFHRPPGLVQVEVCALSGFLPTPACQFRHEEWFIDGTQPTQYDSFYKQVMIDSATRQLADQTTPPERQSSLVVLDLPPEAYPWARSQGLQLFFDLQTQSKDHRAGGAALTDPNLSQSPALKIVSPASQSVFRLSADVPEESQQIHVEAIGLSELSNIVIFMDGQILEKFASPPYETWWKLVPGMHQVWVEARNISGEIIKSPEVNFQVK
jgi:membrane carboxypeptidase/penicillin-binding protein PbpC